MNYDSIILNGKIIDGTGNPWFQADVGIKNSKIAKIGRLNGAPADDVLDATGLSVCPGFIDIHSHADHGFLFDPRCENIVHQGITTVLVGQCGVSLSPINPQKKEPLIEFLAHSLPAGVELNLTWNTFEEYLGAMEQLGCAANQAHLVGFGTVRIAGPGYVDRPPTPEELDEMKGYVDEAMRAGAFGMSTGLIYTPQAYADRDELIELANVVAKHNGLYFSHVRSEGAAVVEAFKEAIEITEKSGCGGGQICHHKVMGKTNWGKSDITLKVIEDANDRGINIRCDQYPYTRAMTLLMTVLPPWVHVGGVEKILERLQNPEDLEKIKQDINAGSKGWDNWIAECGWNGIFVSNVKSDKWKDMEGKSIAEIMKLKAYPDEFTVLVEILVDEKTEVAMTAEYGDEEELKRIMRGRYNMVGTDSWVAAPTGVLSHGTPHPRFYGTYPRVLGKYVREEKVLLLEDAIRRMTSFPAQRLGLRDRGLLREGMFADIVIFDPATIIDTATYENPHQFPEGIKYVLVNGVTLIKDNDQIDNLPGHILRQPD